MTDTSTMYLTEEQLRARAIGMLNSLPIQATIDLLHKHEHGEWFRPSMRGTGDPKDEKFFGCDLLGKRSGWSAPFDADACKARMDPKEWDVPLALLSPLRELLHRYIAFRTRSSGFGLNFDEQIGHIRGMKATLDRMGMDGLRISYAWQAMLY